MKIERMSLHVVPLDQWGGKNRYAHGQRLSPPLEANIVRLDAENGLTGWGESCGIPPYYLPTLSPVVREAIKYVAPLVVGTDARAPLRTMHEIEAAMRGQAPAKAAIDMALWDLCGKLHGVPLCDLWGGRVSEDMPVLAMVSIGTPDQAIRQMEDYRAQGYSLFQVKVAEGTVEGDIEHITRVSGALKPGERCWFDANRGWTVDEAVRVLQKVSHLGPLIEQPCETYHECLTVSRRTGLGLMLDEVIDSPEALTQAHSDGIIDAAVLKLGCVGGLTRQRHLAQVGARLGIPMRIEDYYGTGLTLAAVTHVAHTLPPKATFGLYDYHLPELPIVTNPPAVRNGRIALPKKPGPGLGVEVDESLLGKAVYQTMPKKKQQYSLSDLPFLSNPLVRDLLEKIRAAVLSMDPRVTESITKYYVSFRAKTSFADVLPQSKRLVVVLNMNFQHISDPRGLCRDVSRRGHLGKGNVEVRLDKPGDLDYVMSLVRQAFVRQFERKAGD